jgi:hypothetical protein
MSNDDRLSVLIVWYFVLYESLDPVGAISDGTIQNDAVVFVTILHAPVCDPQHSVRQFDCLYDIISFHLIDFPFEVDWSSSDAEEQLKCHSLY